jgi:hypothetical protein
VLSADDDEPALAAVVPVVDYDRGPRVRIYDAADDSSFWYRVIGFR